MFDVIACGFTPALLESHPASREITVLPEPAAPDFLDAGYDALAARDPGRAALLLAPGGALNRRRLATLRAAVRSEGVLGLSLARPLTSLAAASTLLASLSARGIAPGVAAGHLTLHLPQLLPTYAVTTSVAGLDLPEVRIRHHLMSWVPGTVFSVALDDHVAITTSNLRVELANQADGVALVSAGQERLAGRLRGVTPAHVIERFVVPVSEQSLWWGTPRFYEQTVMARDAEQILAEISAEPVTPCRQCGRDVVGECPFCATREGRAA